MNRLEFISKEVDKLTDNLGMKVDPGIKHAVIAFNFAGFQTSMSCEGHIKIWGYPFPWIDIDDNEFGNVAYLMQESLDKFYSFRDKTCLTLQIVLQSKSGFRVQSCGNFDIDKSVSHKDFIKSLVRDEFILLACRQEMNDFADFLIKENL